MPKPCSVDLRERVLEAVMTGASRREAAERLRSAPVLQSNGCNAGIKPEALRPSRLGGARRRWRSTRTFCWG